MTKAERAAFLEVAAWCDEEYRRLCMIPLKSPHTEDALKTEGMRAKLADLGFALRRGRLPDHQKVDMQWEADFNRQVRQENAR
jgi:hypothetical protein